MLHRSFPSIWILEAHSLRRVLVQSEFYMVVEISFILFKNTHYSCASLVHRCSRAQTLCSAKTINIGSAILESGHENST